MIEPTMIHAGAMPPHLQLGWGRDMIFPPPCHFGKQAIMIYDDSFSSGSPSATTRNDNVQKEGGGACNRDIMDLKMPNFSLRDTATFPSLRMAI